LEGGVLFLTLCLTVGGRLQVGTTYQKNLKSLIEIYQMCDVREHTSYITDQTSDFVRRHPRAAKALPRSAIAMRRRGRRRKAVVNGGFYLLL